MIFVIGTGRSGTSTVSRILHTRCDVCMGRELPKRRGEPVYEDQAFSTLNHWLSEGPPHEEAVTQLKALVATRGEPWGMKCPATADFLPLYNEVCPEARYIWCARDLVSVRASLKRVRPEYDATMTTRCTTDRWAAIEAFTQGLPPERLLRLWFGVPVREEDIYTRLVAWL